mmetsp:Transcript_53067/g.102550  ORF Transcript_53067/g.102550 Transcript_53067/m.102550 type:complete len:91 (-) Transcript_53067:55-327(-)
MAYSMVQGASPPKRVRCCPVSDTEGRDDVERELMGAEDLKHFCHLRYPAASASSSPLVSNQGVRPAAALDLQIGREGIGQPAAALEQAAT